MAKEKRKISFYSLRELDNFVSESNDLIIYGAGDYAHRLIGYMHKRGMSIKAACVSDGELICEQSIFDVPVKHLSELKSASHIILAVNSKHHEVILSAINSKNRDNKVLILRDGFFDFTLKFLLFLPSVEKMDFFAKARSVLEEYQCVEFCFGTTMQCFGLMMFFCNQTRTGREKSKCA